MQNGWTTTKLGGLIQTLKGYAFKSQWYSVEGVPLVKVSDFTDDAIDIAGLARIPNEIAANYSRYELKTDDVVIQTVGSWATNPQSVVGKVIRVPRKANGALLNQNAVKIIPKESIDNKFLFYALRSLSFKNYIIGCAQGAASQASITLDAIRNYDFRFPQLEHQCRIAAILSAYDGLIENNMRRIQILEEMARQIYEEWFVQFRFPGHENAKMVESELGLIPNGWCVITLQDSCSFISRGISPKYNDASEQFVINQKCIRDEKLNLELARRHSSNVPNDKLVRFGDVLINSTGVGTLGRVAQVYSDIHNYTVDSHVTIARPKNEINKEYFGLSLLRLQSHFDRLGFGATGQTELSRASVSNTEILLPPLELRELFSKLVSPIRENAVVLTKKNANLRGTRDLLLPALISGEIDVENL